MIPVESESIETSKDRGIGQIPSPKPKITSSSHSNNSKHNGVLEPAQTKCAEVIPQSNIITPEATQLTRKEEGDGWITVQKRRSVKQRNSMVIA